MSHFRRPLIAAALTIVTATIVTAPGFADDTGFAYMHGMTTSGGRTCFTDHFHAGHGKGKTKAEAFNAALKDWWSYTAGEYGSDWARWSRSASKGIKYSQSGGEWSAVVESRPCK